MLYEIDLYQGGRNCDSRTAMLFSRDAGADIGIVAVLACNVLDGAILLVIARCYFAFNRVK